MDHLQKNKERIQKFKETEDSRYIYQNESKQNKKQKSWFQHDMNFGEFKDLMLLKIQSMMIS